MAAQQVAQHLARHTGCCPRRDGTGCHHARVGKAGFFCGCAPALKNGDFVAINSQLVSRGDADDASAYNGNLHGACTTRKELEMTEFMFLGRF